MTDIGEALLVAVAASAVHIWVLRLRPGAQQPATSGNLLCRRCHRTSRALHVQGGVPAPAAARVVSVASKLHLLAACVRTEPGPRFSALHAYNESKLAQVRTPATAVPMLRLLPVNQESAVIGVAALCSI